MTARDDETCAPPIPRACVRHGGSARPRGETPGWNGPREFPTYNHPPANHPATQ